MHGGAGYFTREGALLRALYEWAARDGFFYHWLARAKVRQIKVTEKCALLMRAGTAKLLREVTQKGFTVTMLDVSRAPGVYSLFCVLHSVQCPHARIVCGSGASVSFEDAYLSALEEALSMHHWLAVYGGKITMPDTYDPYTTSWRDKERLSWWATCDMSALDFFIDSADIAEYDQYRESEYEQPKDDAPRLAAIVHLWSEAGYELLYSEAAHPLLADVGYHSVRVLISEMYPMYHDTRNFPEKYMERDGLATRDPVTPHPFP
jgi:ribosomal protein S12 methylthiotransferase accessory factor YcaO